MRITRIAPVVALWMVPALAIAACVTVNLDTKADFSQYKTYSWGNCSVEGHPLVEVRIIAALEENLSARGLKKVEDQGDIRVAYHGSTRKDITADGWGYAPGPGWQPTRREKGFYEVGTLVVDLVDGASGRLVWRGVAPNTLVDDPWKHEKKINKAAERMFALYPVKPAK